MNNRLFQISSFIILSFLPSSVWAQEVSPDYAKAKQFIMQAKYDSATIYLQKALSEDPNNLAMLEDNVYLEYQKRDFVKAMQIGKPLVDRPDAKVKTFQVLGLVYKEIADYKEAKKVYDLAILKHPNSGLLYSEYGDMYLSMNNGAAAIKQFEKGIEMDPGFGNNYYHAANYYAGQKNPLWAMLYAEIFVNIESYTARTAEMKSLLTELYKKISLPGFLTNKNSSEFSNVVAQTYIKQPPITIKSLNVEALTALRRSFIKDWYQHHSNRYPFRLFEYHYQLNNEGLFDAYNQWLFGETLNSEAYNKWILLHPTKMDAFTKFQGGRIFKIPTGQYYQAR